MNYLKKQSYALIIALNGYKTPKKIINKLLKNCNNIIANPPFKTNN